MAPHRVLFTDASGRNIAISHVALEGDRYEGSIDLCSTPVDVHALFDEFEEIVNGQMLAFLDDVQSKVEALQVRAMFDDGRQGMVADLQVFPRTGSMSFRIMEADDVDGSLSSAAAKTSPGALSLNPELDARPQESS